MKLEKTFENFMKNSIMDSIKSEYDHLPLMVRRYIRKIELTSTEEQIKIWTELTKRLDAKLANDNSESTTEYKKIRWPQIDHTNTI